MAEDPALGSAPMPSIWHQRKEALRELAKGMATKADLARRFRCEPGHDFEASDMGAEFLLNPEQFHQLINSLKSDAPSFWPSWPIFWGAFSGVCSGIVLDLMRRGIDKRKAQRERDEKEVQLINIVLIGIGHNVTLLITACFQHLLPHFDDSHAARAELEKRKGNSELLAEFAQTINSYRGMRTTCPKFRFIEKNLLEDIPFIIQKDPDILLTFARTSSDYDFFAAAVQNRNQHILETAKAAASGQVNLFQMEAALDLQISISHAECIYAHQLLTGNLEIAQKLEAISAGYKVKIQKKRLVVPPALSEAIQQLESRLKAHVAAFANLQPAADGAPGGMPIKESYKADIEEGQRLRGWIANAYAQIEFLLGDLILRCRAFPEYEAETATFTHSVDKRVGKVRRMLQKAGRLEPFAAELTSIVDRFEERREIRNLLVHGFCTYLCTPSGDAALQFQKWHRQPDRDDARLRKCFRLCDLAAEEDSLVALSGEASRLFQRMHKHFAWEARRADPIL